MADRFTLDPAQPLKVEDGSDVMFAPEEIVTVATDEVATVHGLFDTMAR